MVFNLDGIIGKHHDIRIRDAKVISFLAAGVNILGIFQSDIAAIEGIAKNHLLFFVAQAAFQNGAIPLDETGFVHIESIGTDSSLNDIFTESEGGIDDDDILEACFRVE